MTVFDGMPSTDGGRVYDIWRRCTAIGYAAPSLANALTLTGAANAWTLGDAVEVINGGSATSVTSPFTIDHVWISNASANEEYQVNFYANGTYLGCVVFEKTAAAEPNFSLDIDCPGVVGGAVITAKMASKGGGADTCTIKVKYIACPV